MIIDSCKNAAIYASLSPRIQKAFEYLSTIDVAAMDEGRYQIDSDDIFFMIVARDLKSKKDAMLEVHDLYADIQIIIQGEEGFGWRDRTECTAPRGEMDTAKDILFYDDAPSTYFTIKDGQFAIFLPGDAHAPLVGEGGIRKCIVKVRV